MKVVRPFRQALLVVCFATMALLCQAQFPGCTSPGACNYEDFATDDNGTCCFDNCLTLFLYDAFGDGWNGTQFSIVTIPDSVEVLTGTLAAGSSQEIPLCFPDGCYGIFVSGGLFIGEVSFSVESEGEVIASGNAYQDDEFGFGITCPGEEVYGCTESEACNYEPLANTDDASCCFDACITLTLSDNSPEGLVDNTYSLVDQTTGAVLDFIESPAEDEPLFYCLPEGCYQIELGYESYPDEIEVLLTSSEAFSLGQIDETHFYFTLGSADCSGCNDPSACNYDPASSSGNLDCLYPECSDPLACNYDALAECTWTQTCVYSDTPYLDCEGNCLSDVDGDGVCDQLETEGCLYAHACNYNPFVLIDDNSCQFPGCVNPSASNYEPWAACDDGSCLLEGCTYAAALNFNPLATQDDGACNFACNIFCPADLTGDGLVNTPDIIALIAAFGVNCNVE